MKKNIVTILFALLVALSATGQTNTDYPTFLNKHLVADHRCFLPAPPDTASKAFEADTEAYRESKKLRNTSRGLLAVEDADISIDRIMKVMSDITGTELERTKCPNLFILIEKVMNDGYLSGSEAKKYYKRTRPFVYFNEPTSIPSEEESHRKTYSYPSSHSAMAWAATLVMTELFPECQNDLLHWGYEAGQSRVIAGYHYQSDVDAARLAASAVVARLHAEKEFRRSMKKAEKEIRRIRK